MYNLYPVPAAVSTERCGVCADLFDDSQRRPKHVVACGHTFCLKCLLSIEGNTRRPIKCPECQEEAMSRGVRQFPDNYDLLSLIGRRDVDSKFYCLDCSTVASPACIAALHRHRDIQESERNPPVPQVKLKLWKLSWTYPGEDREEKIALLQCYEVHALYTVMCKMDPDWVLQLLRRHSSTLEELELLCADREHLQQLQRMPRLRRLNLQDCQSDVRDYPALPGAWRGQLEWLRVEDVPRQLLQDILLAQRDSLQELELRVNTGKQWEEDWVAPFMAPLAQRLPTLVLLRDCNSHVASVCQQQLHGLRVALPNCTVMCDSCPTCHV